MFGSLSSIESKEWNFLDASKVLLRRIEAALRAALYFNAGIVDSLDGSNLDRCNRAKFER
jgi:hypothetical protein